MSSRPRSIAMSDNTAFAPPGNAADLEEGVALTPKFDADGLVTCVTTDAGSGVVLMVAHMNGEALAKTIASGEAWYYSRSRRALWRKGEIVRPHPARRRDAYRLRPGCRLDQGRTGRQCLPYRPTLVLLSGGAARQGRRGQARIPRRTRVRSEYSLPDAITRPRRYGRYFFSSGVMTRSLPFDFPAAVILFQAAGLSGVFRDHEGFVISADRFAAFDAQPGVGQDFQPAGKIGLPHLSLSRFSLIKAPLGFPAVTASQIAK